MAYFPMFIELNQKPCLVVGGGSVALRKVQVLLDFGATVTVTAPEICEEIRSLMSCMAVLQETEEPTSAAGAAALQLMARPYEETDLSGKTLVIAATDDRELNHRIACRCRELGTPVNAVDQPEDCTFIFPSYVKEQNLVAAFSSGGNSPVLTQYLKEREKEILTPELGEIGEYFGEIRSTVKEQIGNERDRKAFYQALLKQILETGELPETEDMTACIIK